MSAGGRTGGGHTTPSKYISRATTVEILAVQTHDHEPQQSSRNHALHAASRYTYVSYAIDVSWLVQAGAPEALPPHPHYPPLPAPPPPRPLPLSPFRTACLSPAPMPAPFASCRAAARCQRQHSGSTAAVQWQHSGSTAASASCPHFLPSLPRRSPVLSPPQPPVQRPPFLLLLLLLPPSVRYFLPRKPGMPLRAW